MEKIKKRTHFFLIFAVFFALVFGAVAGALAAMTINVINSENFTEFTAALPTKILDINGELITEYSSDEKREIISITQIPQHFLDALLTREDQVFYKHKGFSVKSILRAVVGKVAGLSLGGGSTLTQQIAGTLYCDRKDISITRKLVELWWAIQMERRYSKDEILELYLNQVYLGGGTYGVSTASKYYFGHGVEKITPAESAILVIQLSSPTYYNPFNYPNRARERQQYVLGEMVSNGYITKEVADASFDEYWLNFDYTRTNTGALNLTENRAPWFSEYVRRELDSLYNYATNSVYTDGLTVNTTLNLQHQAAADEVMAKYIALANDSYQASSGKRRSDAINTYIPMTELFSLVFNIPELRNSELRRETEAMSQFRKEINPMLDIFSMVCGIENLKVGVVNKTSTTAKDTSRKDLIEGTMIELENSTGYITALVGGSTYDDDNQFIRATQATLQPGSTFKPLYYSAAIDSRKLTATTMIYDTPVIFYKEDGSPYLLNNFKGEFMGHVQLWYALATSMNIPSVKILNEVGFDAAINRAAALLGIDESEYESRSLKPVYSLGLGVCVVQPIQMARAFAIFANQGKEVTPMAIRNVEDKNGNIILNPEREIREAQQAKGENIQVISPQTAFVMTSLLQNTVSMGTLARGSGWGSKLRFYDENGKRFSMPAAGKTGTTQNWEDAWTVAFTPYYTSAWWFGFDQKGNTLGTSLTGATLAGVAWGDFVQMTHKNLPYKDFPSAPQGVVQAKVCSVSGGLLTSDCEDYVTRYYLEGTEPTELCTYHALRKVAEIRSLDLLNTERLQSGLSDFDVSPTTLVFDLSFLDHSEESDEDGEGILIDGEEGAVAEISELGYEIDANGLPLTNYLLD
ncbi:MAG: PBP1A family penicillin-binding protein [Treponemataceae bacterium]|nr:PBP1A family penicillin-binding protein [Treponemataceae bacterium]